MLRPQPCPFCGIKYQAIHLRRRADVEKQGWRRVSQRCQRLGLVVLQRQVDQQPGDPLSQQLLQRQQAGRLGRLFRHGDNNPRPGLCGAVFHRRGDLGRRMESQIAGKQPEGAATLARQLLRPPVGNVVQLAHGKQHLLSGTSRDVLRLVNDAGDGLVGDARETGDIVKRNGFHGVTWQPACRQCNPNRLPLL